MSNIRPAPEPTYSEYQLKDISKNMMGKKNRYITLNTAASVWLYVFDISFGNEKTIAYVVEYLGKNNSP